MEDEGRRTLQLAPGAIELGKWMQWWRLPFSIVTRNTQSTVEHLHERLWCPHGLQKFQPAVAREFVPTKPHPAALEMIAWQWDLPLGPGLLMVGDSPSNEAGPQLMMKPKLTGKSCQGHCVRKGCGHFNRTGGPEGCSQGRSLQRHLGNQSSEDPCCILLLRPFLRP